MYLLGLITGVVISVLILCIIIAFLPFPIFSKHELSILSNLCEDRYSDLLRTYDIDSLDVFVSLKRELSDINGIDKKIKYFKNKGVKNEN